MTALVHQVALVSKSNRVKLPDLMRVSAALQKQASRDLEPIWEITATVDAFTSLERGAGRLLADDRQGQHWNSRCRGRSHG